MKIVEDAVRELGGVWPSDDVDAVHLYKLDARYVAGLAGGTAHCVCTRAEFVECTRRLRPEEKKMEEKNDCHERGELPPVGAMVSYPTGQGVLLLPPDDVGIVVVQESEGEIVGQYKRVAMHAIRPLQTERERWVDSAERAMRSTSPELDRLQLAAIYDAGLAKMPEDE